MFLGSKRGSVGCFKSEIQKNGNSIDATCNPQTPAHTEDFNFPNAGDSYVRVRETGVVWRMRGGGSHDTTGRGSRYRVTFFAPDL